MNELRYFLVLAYLRKNVTSLGRINLTIDDMVSDCGYVPDSHPNKTNDSFKNLLQNLIDGKYLACNCDITKVNRNKMFTLELTSDKEHNLFYSDTSFVLLSIAEFDKITKCKSKINKAVLLAVYLSIKQYITIDGTVPDSYSKVAYPSKYGIQKRLGISSKTTVEKAIQKLVELHMLYEYVGGYYLDSQDLFEPTNNGYALSEKEINGAENALKQYYHVDKIYKYNEIDVERLKYPNRK